MDMSIYVTMELAGLGWNSFQFSIEEIFLRPIYYKEARVYIPAENLYFPFTVSFSRHIFYRAFGCRKNADDLSFHFANH